MEFQSPAPSRRNPPRRAKAAAVGKTPGTTTRSSARKRSHQESIKTLETLETQPEEASLNPGAESSVAEDQQNAEEEKIEIPEAAKEKSESKDSNLRVFLRIRPAKKKSLCVAPQRNGRRKASVEKELEQQKEVEEKLCLFAKDEHSVTLVPSPAQEGRRSKTEVYNGFARVFHPETSQDDVYEHVMHPLVKEFMEGRSYLLVAMGPTSSGKTHTMFGNTKEQGLIPRALQKLLAVDGDHNANATRNYYISMFEIYSERGRGEKVFDLFQDGAELSFQQSAMKGLKEVPITSVEEAEASLYQGMEKRTTASTNANNQSSRSQCIINIRSVCKVLEEKGRYKKTDEAVLTIVDLAGAEREKKTGNQGIRFNESNFINNTSMVFGQCLRALLEHQKNPKRALQRHFHSSLLTRYLKDYMEGKGRMVMVLTVSPEDDSYNDTAIVLRQASPYVDIRFNPSEDIPNVLRTKRSSNVLSKEFPLKRAKLSTGSNEGHLKDQIDQQNLEGLRKLDDKGHRKCSDVNTSLVLNEGYVVKDEEKALIHDSSKVSTLSVEDQKRITSLAVDCAVHEHEMNYKKSFLKICSEAVSDVVKIHAEMIKVEDFKELVGQQNLLCKISDQSNSRLLNTLNLGDERANKSLSEPKKRVADSSEFLDNSSEELRQEISILVDSALHAQGKRIYEMCMETFSETLGHVLRTHEEKVKMLEKKLMMEKEQSTELKNEIYKLLSSRKRNTMNEQSRNQLSESTDALLQINDSEHMSTDTLENGALLNVTNALNGYGDLQEKTKQQALTQENATEKQPENVVSSKVMKEKSDIDSEELSTRGLTLQQDEVSKASRTTMEGSIPVEERSSKNDIELSSTTFSKILQTEMEKDAKSKFKKGRMIALCMVDPKKESFKLENSSGVEAAESEGPIESSNTEECDFGPIGQCLEELLGTPIADIEKRILNADVNQQMKQQVDVLITDVHELQLLKPFSAQQSLCLRYCLWILQKISVLVHQKLDRAETKLKTWQTIFSGIIREKTISKAALLVRQGLEDEGISENLDQLFVNSLKVSTNKADEKAFNDTIKNKENILPSSGKKPRRKLPPTSSLFLKNLEDTSDFQNAATLSTKTSSSEQLGLTKGRASLAKYLI